jgi:hypothetical protein
MYEVSKSVYGGKHPYTEFPDDPDESYKQAIIRAALEYVRALMLDEEIPRREN